MLSVSAICTRTVKNKVRASQCFKSFYTAEQTLEGIKSVNMMRNG
jgi:hypothetical protein